MPNITIEGPPIKDLDVKRKLVKGLTEVGCTENSCSDQGEFT